MTTRTLAEIDADITALEAVRRQRLTGKMATEVGYANNNVKFAAASIADINAELARLQIERSKITGCSSGVGPIRIGFGDRT